MAGLWDALKQYIGDALPGGALNPETAPVAKQANYLSGILDPASQVSQDAQAWHKRTQNGLMDQLAGRDTPEAEQAYQTMMQAAGVAPVGMFIGKGAKTWDAVMMGKAQQMAQEGADPRAIWKETGTWQGPDGAWRQEIPDNAAAFTPTKWDRPYKNALNVQQANTGDVMSHLGLYEAYPNFKDMPVVLNPNIKSNAQYHAPNPDIDLGEYVQMKYNRDSKIGYENDFLGRMLNPNSDDHWLKQAKEATEMNPRDAKREMVKFVRETEQAVKDMKNGLLWPSNASNRPKSELLHEIQHGIQQREGWARGGSSNQFEPVQTSAVKAGIPSQAAFDKYLLIAGEAEARATQARMKMDAAQRRATFPADSYDVPLDSLIVRR